MVTIWNRLLPQQNIQACTAMAEMLALFWGFLGIVTANLQ
jgi:hypothetical protein